MKNAKMKAEVVAPGESATILFPPAFARRIITSSVPQFVSDEMIHVPVILQLVRRLVFLHRYSRRVSKEAELSAEQNG